jgi:rubrerythrin
MEPRLAQARDRYGQTMFVAVWRCPQCGRMSY